MFFLCQSSTKSLIKYVSAFKVETAESEERLKVSRLTVHTSVFTPQLSMSASVHSRLPTIWSQVNTYCICNCSWKYMMTVHCITRVIHQIEFCVRDDDVCCGIRCSPYMWHETKKVFIFKWKLVKRVKASGNYGPMQTRKTAGNHAPPWLRDTGGYLQTSSTSLQVQLLDYSTWNPFHSN